MEYKTLKHKYSVTKRITAVAVMVFILVYGFYYKDIPQHLRATIAYAVIALFGILVILRGYYFGYRKKVSGRSVYLLGAAMLIYGTIKILTIFNLL